MRSVPLALVLVAAGVIPSHAADQAPSTTDIKGGGASLSDKLSATGGVIHPNTDIDPAIKVAPPRSDTTTPVIPPPGSPGGDPDVKPK